MVVDIIKGKKFATKDGTLVDAEVVLKDNKVICFYFSAHWCPPCRGFTPILKDFFDEIKGEKDIVIVFVSSDRSADDMASYFSEHGDYMCLPFEDKETKANLGKEFGVSGIPALIVCKTDGTLITKSGRNDVGEKDPASVRKSWINA